jgi:hypothetical protein
VFLNNLLSLNAFQIIPHVSIIYLRHYDVNTFKKFTTLVIFLAQKKINHWLHNHWLLLARMYPSLVIWWDYDMLLILYFNNKLMMRLFGHYYFNWKKTFTRFQIWTLNCFLHCNEVNYSYIDVQTSFQIW